MALSSWKLAQSRHFSSLFRPLALKVPKLAPASIAACLAIHTSKVCKSDSDGAHSKHLDCESKVAAGMTVPTVAGFF